MTITEIALLQLVPPTVADDETLRSKLAMAKNAMEEYTGYQFRYYQEIEDPSRIYIIGEWDSLDQHYNKWVPSEKNQKLLDVLKGLATVEYLIHLEVPPQTLPLSASVGGGPNVISITRHFIKDGERDRFQQIFNTNKHYAEEFVTEGNMGGGWRVDKDGAKEEFVLFFPWKDVDQHYSFAKTEGFPEYAKIKDACADASIKHLRFFF
jgi:heme-degrading monooxygenase HmoA